MLKAYKHFLLDVCLSVCLSYMSLI